MKTLLFLAFLVHTAVCHAGALTAHIGCAGGLGSERACAGDTITCINTSKSDLPNRLVSLHVGYTEANGTVEPPVDVLTGALGAFFRVPLTSTPPYYVQEAVPNQELDVVYLVNTDPDDVGPFIVQAETHGEVTYDDVNWLAYSAGYGLRVMLADCTTLSPAARTRVALARPRIRHFHKMHVHRSHHP